MSWYDAVMHFKSYGCVYFTTGGVLIMFSLDQYCVPKGFVFVTGEMIPSKAVIMKWRILPLHLSSKI